MSEFRYDHEYGDKIIEEALGFFEYSESSQNLRKSLENEPYKITTMTGPVSQCFVPNTKTIIMRLPALYTSAKIEQAIDLAGALAELEILRKGSAPKADEIETEKYAIAQHYKNLDIILRTFEIAQEWDNAGYRASLEIFRMGLRNLYKAWKKNDEYQSLSDIYWQLSSEK